MKYIQILVLAIVYSSYAEAFEMRKCLGSNSSKWDELTKADYDAGYYLSCVVETDEDGIVYTFDSSIGKTNYKKGELLKGWPLTRWQYLSRPLDVLKDHAQIGVGNWKESIEYDANTSYAGCLNQHPLRYGDLEGDGTNEIILTLNGELIVFSPDYQRNVFATFDDVDDWLRDPSMIGTDKASDLVEDDAYQYLSEHLMYNGYSHRAHRSYTKLYVGDYDKDGNSDILIWQKVYVSNKVGEEAGFHLISNEVKHYESDLKAQEESAQGITGEYLPQATDEATIKGWLTDNNLTWQKGYPDKSECAGEEGKPITEMVDPLLNDPEVLQ
jgi:hypothetical protein